MAISMAFDEAGKVRETWIVQSSGSAFVDEWMQSWITTRWKARPELMRQRFYKGKPLTPKTRFVLRLSLIYR